MSKALDDYFAALDRLVKGRPGVVPKGSKITNDSVSIEAGRGKGSIKKSRAVFEELIRAIDEAAATQVMPDQELKERLDKARAKSAQYRQAWEAALAREVSLLYELYETKKKLAMLTGDKVTPIRGATSTEIKK